MLKNNNDEATNDFDLGPEKIAPKSTIRRQINTVERLIEQKHVLTTSRILPTFDRLKIYIDLEKYGKKIGFKIGKNLKRSDFPELSPYEQKVRLNNISRVKFHADDTDQADDYDSETADNTNSTSHKYDNYSISYDIFINTLGINKVYVKNDKLVIDITGKLMCGYNDLGFLSAENIENALKKLQELELFNCDIEKFLQYANVYLLDLTIDLELSTPNHVQRMIKAMSSYYPLYQNTHSIFKYKRHGLLYRKKTKNAGWAFTVYCKGEELSHNYANPDKRVYYTDTIGEIGELRANKTLRLELHLSTLAAIREILGLENKGYGIVPLTDVLYCRKPVILDMLRKIGMREEKIYQALQWYEPKCDLLEEDEAFLDERDFTELVMAEHISKIIVENNYDITIAKNHILTEYNFDIGSKFENKILPLIRNNLYNYLAYRKPKTQTLVFLVLSSISNLYFGDSYIPGETCYSPEEINV